MNIEELKKKVLEIDPFCDINFFYLEDLLKSHDPNLLLQNWKAHIEWWESEYGQKDKKWLKNEEKALKKDPIEFIESGLYERDWNVQKIHPRDNYLFPQHLTMEQLYDFTRAIKEKIQQEKDRHRSSSS